MFKKNIFHISEIRLCEWQPAALYTSPSSFKEGDTVYHKTNLGMEMRVKQTTYRHVFAEWQKRDGSQASTCFIPQELVFKEDIPHVVGNRKFCVCLN